MSENKNKQQRGQFIVIYGNNNIGKSTQAKLFVERMKKENMPVRYIKYPIYDLAPTGLMINAYLREGNPHGLSAREAQTLYAMNRTQFEPTLKSWLDAGENVVAEDYTGTSLGWGQGTGVSKEYLLEVNSHLLEPDTILFMDGDRFLIGKEKKHIHEQNDSLINKVGKIFQNLAKELNWTTVDAVGDMEEVHERMWEASGL
jgi:dTMP kinase